MMNRRKIPADHNGKAKETPVTSHKWRSHDNNETELPVRRETDRILGWRSREKEMSLLIGIQVRDEKDKMRLN